MEKMKKDEWEMSDNGTECESEMTPLKKQSDKKGLTLLTGTLYVFGELISIAFLVLPKTMAEMGISGLLLLILLSAVSAYTAVILTKCLDIVEEVYGLQQHLSDTYSTIAFHATGKIGRILVSVINTISLTGVAIISIIFNGQLLQELFQDVLAPHDISFCYWMLIFSAGLAPLTWFGTPKDMGPIAFCSYASVCVSCVLVIVAYVMAIPAVPTVTHQTVSFASFMMGFGKLTFMNKGHVGIPTIQMDMENKKVFYRAVIISFILVLSVYIPVAYAGYFIFGNKAEVDILVTLSRYLPGSKIIMVIQILVIIHNGAVALIYFNPVFQHLEDSFNVENAFGFKRVIIRTLLLIFIVFVCETLPRFGNILSLLGGSTLTLLVYILPLVFYERLCHIGADDQRRHLKLPQRILNYFIIIMAICAGIATTYSAMWDTFSPETWVTPCYINVTAAQGEQYGLQ